MKNKKGNIPITILVIGVVAICILALGSFVYSGFKLNKHFSIGFFEDIQSDVEKFYFYTSDKIKMPNEESASYLDDALIDSGGDLVIKRENKDIIIYYKHKIK